MKKFLFLALMLVTSAAVWAQAPQKFNYQGIARSSSGSPLAGFPIGLRLTIHDGSASGTSVYQETHTPTTNGYGLYNVAVGGGAVVSGTFNTIAWGTGDKYLQVEIDPAGGTSYTDLGANQLLSVPFALNALNSSGATGTVTSINTAAPITGGPITSTGTISLAPSGVTSGVYGSASAVPIITTDIFGRITAMSTAPISSMTSTGTSNYITKFTTSGTAIGNSVMYESAGSIGVGTISPSAVFHAISPSPALNGVVKGEYTGTTTTSNSVGVYGRSIPSLTTDAGWGTLGDGGAAGVVGRGISATTLASTQSIGVDGETTSDADYSIGTAGFADRYNPASAGSLYSYGVYGYGTGAALVANNYAGWFAGNLTTTGTLVKGGGTFKIDHPQDPENKYLSHSFVESPDMMNIYNGNITTDASGTAMVTLPSYFDALNKDFRYQLTVIGTFAQAIVSKEITGNAFEIKTSVPNVKVSWQVTGVRKDVWANAHRVVPETEKPANEKGKYFHAKEYGKDETYQIGSVKKSTGPAKEHTTQGPGSR